MRRHRPEWTESSAFGGSSNRPAVPANPDTPAIGGIGARPRRGNPPCGSRRLAAFDRVAVLQAVRPLRTAIVQSPIPDPSDIQGAPQPPALFTGDPLPATSRRGPSPPTWPAMPRRPAASHSSCPRRVCARPTARPAARRPAARRRRRGASAARRKRTLPPRHRAAAWTRRRCRRAAAEGASVRVVSAAADAFAALEWGGLVQEPAQGVGRQRRAGRDGAAPPRRSGGRTPGSLTDTEQPPASPARFSRLQSVFNLLEAARTPERGRSSGVEHDLAKVGVEGSNPFARSSRTSKNLSPPWSASR
jgi:hypothetical protein